MRRPREILGLILAADPGLDDDELVAAEPGHDIVDAGYRAQAFGDGLEQEIAAIVPERVIDVLEAIEIDEMHGDAAALQRKDGKRLLQFFDQLGAIGQAGQRIVMRHVGDLRLGFLPFGDVLEGRDPAASRHRLVDHAKRAPADVSMTLVAGFAFARVRDHAREKPLRVAGKLSRRFPVLEQVEQGSALEPGSRQTHHLGVTLVKQHDAAIRVEHAKPLRHVLKGGVEQDFLLPQLSLSIADRSMPRRDICRE